MTYRALLAAFLTVSAPALAQHVTAATSNMTHVVDLAGCSLQHTAGPVTYSDGTVFTSSYVSSLPCYNSEYFLGANGDWTGTAGRFAGLNTAGVNQWMRFTLLGPVAEIGAIVNFAPTSGTPFLQALDANSNVIDSFQFDDISTPNQLNTGAFRGIVHSTADIYAIQFSDAFVVAEDIRYSDVSVAPEPASLVLMATGLAGVAVIRRRKRASRHARWGARRLGTA